MKRQADTRPPTPTGITDKLKARELARLDRQLRCILEAVLNVNPHLDRVSVLHVLYGIAGDVHGGRIGERKEP